MAAEHAFADSYSFGASIETLLDSVLRRSGYEVHPTDMTEQRRGIDRLVSRPGEEPLAVEYKADRYAHITGNAAIEHLSSMQGGVYGWLWTCRADRILYVVVETREVLLLRPQDLRNHISANPGKYQTRRISNRGYTTLVYLVPLRTFRSIAFHNFYLNSVEVMVNLERRR